MQTTLSRDMYYCNLPDDVLFQLAQSGEQRAFECLVECHTTVLRRIISRIVRNEFLTAHMLQYVFIQLYCTLPTLRSGNTLKAWLSRVAENRCMDELRRKRPVYFSEMTEVEDEDETSFTFSLPDPAPLPEEIVIQSERKRILSEAIGQLPLNYRRVVQMHSIEQLNFREVGKVPGIPVTTAKTQFYRALPLLRAWFNSRYEEEAI